MSSTPSNVSRSIPPAGTLLIILNQVAETLGLSLESDEHIRSSISAYAAYELINEMIQNHESAPNSGWAENISSRVWNIGDENGSLYTSCPLSEVLISRNRPRDDIAKASMQSSVVQVMELIDDFCSRFGVSSLGEKELKYAVPCDAAVQVIASLSFDASFARCQQKDWIIVGRCRRIRHERNIDLATDPYVGMIPVDRSWTTNALEDVNSSKPSVYVEEVPFTESFPLHAESVLQHSGPKLVIALSFAAVISLVTKWLRQYPRKVSLRFWEEYPFDCLVRGIKGFPNSLGKSEWLMKESLRTKGRHECCSLSALDRKIDEVCSEYSLGSEVRDSLRNSISITYCYMVVFGEINRKDSKALSKSGRWISVGRLKMFETRDKKESKVLDI